jgi:hypothetical protein
MPLQIIGVTLTDSGEDALVTMRGLFPESSDEELFTILCGIVRDEPKLDYFIIEKNTQELYNLVKCPCTKCKEDHYVSLGWKGHRQWIVTDLCPSCYLKEYVYGSSNSSSRDSTREETT